MNRAFIFDMDGVLVDNERYWGPIETPFLERILGKKVMEKIGQPVGLGLKNIYDLALELGAEPDWDEFVKGYEEVAMKVYDVSPITKGVDRLANRLLQLDFKIGVVTQSPLTWIDRVVPRLSFKEKIDVIISIREHPELRPKPEPDGFLAACTACEAEPKDSIVLEDSIHGIASGKTAGCYVTVNSETLH